jgi:hypothetical protein
MEKQCPKLNWYYYRPDEGCDDKFICQYMRLDYLIRLLEKKQYYVKRRRTFEDANESYKNIKLAFALGSIGNNCTQQPKVKERLIPYTDIIHCPTACWSKHERESYLMWKSYATEIGACIRTTVHNFIASLQIDLDIIRNDNKVLCGSMKYDYFRPSTIEEHQLFDKDIVYADENEFRFYFLLASDTEKKKDEIKGIDVPVDTKVMIDEILLSPFICKEAANRIARMINYAYDIDVRLSNIKLKL